MINNKDMKKIIGLLFGLIVAISSNAQTVGFSVFEQPRPADSLSVIDLVDALTYEQDTSIIHAFCLGKSPHWAAKAYTGVKKRVVKNRYAGLRRIQFTADTMMMANYYNQNRLRRELRDHFASEGYTEDQVNYILDKRILWCRVRNNGQPRGKWGYYRKQFAQEEVIAIQ